MARATQQPAAERASGTDDRPDPTSEWNPAAAPGNRFPPALADPSTPGLDPAEIPRLTAGIAHDFGNLLSVILSYSGELEQELADPDDRERAAEIRAAAERGAALTRQLISCSRGLPAERVPVDLRAALEEASGLLRRTAGEGVELRFSGAPGLPHVRLGVGQAEQIVVNLIANSRNAMAGGGLIRICTEMASLPPGSPLGTGWFVRLAVADDGAGMDPELTARAVEPFYTTREGAGGTGLGLTTVAAIAHAAGGEVEIESSPGAGTRVVVTLPAVCADGEPLSLPRRQLAAH